MYKKYFLPRSLWCRTIQTINCSTVVLISFLIWHLFKHRGLQQKQEVSFKKISADNLEKEFVFCVMKIPRIETFSFSITVLIHPFL